MSLQSSRVMVVNSFLPLNALVMLMLMLIPMLMSGLALILYGPLDTEEDTSQQGTRIVLLKFCSLPLNV